jgi:hypothetical protein
MVSRRLLVQRPPFGTLAANVPAYGVGGAPTVTFAPNLKVPASGGPQWQGTRGRERGPGGVPVARPPMPQGGIIPALGFAGRPGPLAIRVNRPAAAPGLRVIGRRGQLGLAWFRFNFRIEACGGTSTVTVLLVLFSVNAHFGAVPSAGSRGAFSLGSHGPRLRPRNKPDLT